MSIFFQSDLVIASGMSILIANKPLLSFSANNNRASIVEALPSTVSKEQRSTKAFNPKTNRRKHRNTRSSVKVFKGQVSFFVPGYWGYQHFATSHLIKYIPLKKLRQAAIISLKASGARPRRTAHFKK
jgi:hypothetical protein